MKDVYEMLADALRERDQLRERLSGNADLMYGKKPNVTEPPVQRRPTIPVQQEPIRCQDPTQGHPDFPMLTEPPVHQGPPYEPPPVGRPDRPPTMLKVHDDGPTA